SARRRVASAVGGQSDEIVFTSGGTEADLLGVTGLFAAARAQGRPPRVLLAGIEHPAVLGAARRLEAQGAELCWLPVDGHGRVDPDDVARAARAGAAVLALALANHELGTIQDVAGAAARARAHGVLVHCDAVQALGKIPVAVEDRKRVEEGKGVDLGG